MKQRLVSIIVAVHNLPEYTKLFLVSLLKFTPARLYELIIIDNASKKETQHLLKQYKAQVIRQEENIGVTPAWNLGIKQAQGEFIAFVHNDVLLTPHWLERLTQPLADTEVWCVSPRLSRQNLPRDFANLAQLINDQPSKYFRSYLERACFVMPRKAVDALGDLDEQLRTYYYDFDYQYRLGKDGHVPVQANNVAIHHFESRTAISIPNLIKRRKPPEWEYLHKKWNMASTGSPVTGGSFEEHMRRLKSVEIPRSLPKYRGKEEGEIEAQKKGKGKIIACINVFNEVEFLPGCVESLVGIDEIHIVDGAYKDFPHKKPWSTDGTVEWIQEQMKKDGRIRLTRCERA